MRQTASSEYAYLKISRARRLEAVPVAPATHPAYTEQVRVLAHIIRRLANPPVKILDVGSGPGIAHGDALGVVRANHD